MKDSEISQANKDTWEKTAVLHRKLHMDQLIEKFKQPGYSRLDKYESSFLLDKIKVQEKDVIQLCCNNARELLSIKNIGANRCVGVDIAEGFIEQGKELASIAGKDLELYAMDVFDIPNTFHNSFDVVYITIGAIVWLKDLDKFMGIVNKLLHSKGYLLLYDNHPILHMFEPESSTPVIPFYSYFKSDPFVEEEWTDYYDATVKFKAKSYSFQHTLEEIFMTCINNNIQIKEYREFPYDISNVFQQYEKYNFPMSFILLGQKQ